MIFVSIRANNRCVICSFVVPLQSQQCGPTVTVTIECTNSQIKTGLQLRPIHHQRDDRSDAHLFLGLLSYRIVNAVRYRLRQAGETCYWTEVKRRMSTQKAITTEGVNALGEKVKLRLCSTPTKAAADIYERLKYKKIPFRRRIKKNDELQIVRSNSSYYFK